MTDRIRPLSALTLALVVGTALLACKKKKKAPPPAVTSAKPATAAPKAAQGFTGNYTIQSGTSPAGSAYKGSVSITKSGDYDLLSYTITSGGSSFKGVGLESGDLLGVGWGTGKSGVVVYQVSGGLLNGKWVTTGASGLGTEELKGPAGVKGTYTIISSSSPQDGGTYHGRVTITPNGVLRTVKWSLTSRESYSGVGILDGNVFTVGWGTGVGVAVYHKTASGLSGRVSGSAAKGVSTEVLARK